MTPTILLVDDEPDIIESLVFFLEQTMPHVRVLTASSASAALKILERERPTIIVSDYKMPGMTGLELLARCREKMPEMKRIMITAFPDPSLATRASEEAGVALMISKPFDLDNFIGVLEGMIRHESVA